MCQIHSAIEKGKRIFVFKLKHYVHYETKFELLGKVEVAIIKEKILGLSLGSHLLRLISSQWNFPSERKFYCSLEKMSL